MKTILLHVHDDLGAEARLQAACDVARAAGAHIRCAQVTETPDLMFSDVWGGAPLAPSIVQELREIDEAYRRTVEQRLAREDVQWDWVQSEGSAGAGLLAAGLLADLIVATLPQGLRRDLRDPVPLVPDLALRGRVPVLAVPQAAKSMAVTGRAVVAWDGSAPAAAALTAAVPLLKLAETVHVVTIEEAGKRLFPATEAPEYLARHGIGVELLSEPRGTGTVDGQLMGLFDKLAADWIVMGAFGHGRLHEAVFGGVTRRMLRDTRVPLLLAH